MFFLLPYGSDRRTSRFPAITCALIAANVVVFLWLLPVDYRSVMRTFGLTPYHPTMGCILTSMFVHADVLHLAWNLLFLWLFGPNVEDALGRLEYAIFYFGSGFAAALLHVVVVHTFIPAAADVPVVGASGAIAGILGIFAVRFYRTRLKIFWYFGIFVYPLRWGTFTIPAMVGLGIWFVQQLAGGVLSIVNPESGGVAYWSHIGGMVFGMALAYALHMGLAGSKEYLLADAMSDLERGTTRDAVANFRRLVDRDPEDADAHGELARAYAMQLDSEGAVSHYQQSIALHLGRGQRDEAVARFAELKHYYRNARLDLRSEYQLARCLMEANCHAPALQIMEDIASTYPGTPEAEMALMKAGDLHLDTFGNARNALRCYERFLREYPHSAYGTMVAKSLEEARTRLHQDAPG